MKSEILPLPIENNNNILDSAHMSLYRESTNTAQSKLITVVVNANTPTYEYLPVDIPQGTHLTEYIINNNYNYINIDKAIFNINKCGNYKYDIDIKATANTFGVFIMQLVDNNDNVYDNGKFETFGDIYTTGRNYKLTGVIYHKKGDLSKLRISGFISGSPTTSITIQISQIDIFINKL